MMNIFVWSVSSTYSLPGKEEMKSLPDMVIDDVVQALGVNRDDLYEKNRRTKVKFARWLVWKIMQSRGYSYTDCGRLFGSYDHSTVLWALNRVDHDIAHIDYLSEAWECVKGYFREKKGGGII